MSMSDPIADMLTRIRNASQARHSSCEMPTSRMKVAIASVLRDEGYIDSFEERGEGVHKVLRVYLRYAPGGRGRDPVLMGIKRISKPGLRVYTRASTIPRVSRRLEVNGVGYRAAVVGGNLALQVGYSHPVVYPAPAGVTFVVQGNAILISGADKELVGEVAAQIRRVRPPEPYKGKGIKYAEEVIRRKAGKAGAKKK